jgi:hypothetical protein
VKTSVGEGRCAFAPEMLNDSEKLLGKLSKRINTEYGSFQASSMGHSKEKRQGNKRAGIFQGEKQKKGIGIRECTDRVTVPRVSQKSLPGDCNTIMLCQVQQKN